MRPTKTRVLAFVLASIHLALSGCAAPPPSRSGPPAPSEPRPPHIILILADDLGIDLAAYGRAKVPTPRIDAFVRQGLLFERAYAASPICCPARSAIYTGLHPHHNGMYGFKDAQAALEPGIDVIPGLLRPLGYWSAAMGKIHVLPEDRFTWDVPLVARLPRGNAAVAAETASSLLAQGKASGKSIFLLVGLKDPHGGEVEGQGPGLDPGGFAPRDVVFDADGFDFREERELLAGYYDGIVRADRMVGAVLDAIDAAGLADDALVILTSDHGSPEAGGKRALYDKGVRVPLVVRWPGRVAPGTRDGELVGTIDLLPTLFDIAGHRDRARFMHGVSVKARLAGGADAQERALLVGTTVARGPYYYPSRALIAGRYKYIRNLRPDLEAPISRRIDLRAAMPRFPEPMRALALRRIKPPAEELYDLRADPFELVNLASDPQQSARLAAMRAQALAEATRTGDRFASLWEWKPGDTDPYEARYRSSPSGERGCPLCDDEEW